MRHVHTGRYDGTRILRNSRGEERTVEKSVTACGADADGSTVPRVTAVSLIVDGQGSELCPVCRGRVEKATGAQASPLRGKITGPQQSFLRRLLLEAFSKHYVGDVSLDVNHLEGTSARYASFAISHLKAAQSRGWTAPAEL